jgi:hypothetical protein
MKRNPKATSSFLCALLLVAPCATRAVAGQQTPPPSQSSKPEPSAGSAGQSEHEENGGRDSTAGIGAHANKRRAKPSREKEERERLEQERQRLLRERALGIADDMLASSDVYDKLEAALMKADFASLVCSCGQRDRAIEAVRKSLREAFTYLSQAQSGAARRGPSMPPEAVLVKVAEAATKCDPSSRKLLEADLARARATPEQPDTGGPGGDPPVVPDDLWGSKPSLSRQSAASLLVNAAFEYIAGGRQLDAEPLLSRSLTYCVTTPFMVALTRLSSDPGGAQSLFVAAERRVQALPSGQEMSAIDFGLPSVAGISPYAGGVAQAAQNPAGLSPWTATAVGGELDVITALVGDSDAPLVAQSVDAIRMIKDKLPLYAQFRPDALAQVQSWVQQSIQALSPGDQDIALRIPSAAPNPSDQISTIQAVAENSDDEARRDSAYASMVSGYIDQGKFDKAAEALYKISDPALKSEMADAVGFRQVQSEMGKSTDYRKLEPAIDAITSVRLRIKLYIRLAGLALKTDREFATECLQEATSLCSRLDPSPGQSHALLDIAAVYADFDRVTAILSLGYAVRAIDKHNDQPPSRWAGSYVSTTKVKYDDETFTLGRTVVDDPSEYTTKPYDMSVFRKIADSDFDGGVLAASYIDNKSIMASAIYELCAGILLKKAPPTQARPAAPQQARPTAPKTPGDLK